MLLKTHLMFAIFILLIFIQHVNNELAFAVMILVASVLPDLDNGFSSWGRHLIFRPLQFFVKHRGIIHSLTMAIIISVIIAVFYPSFSLGFFIGYSIHLLCDSFTKRGIQPFWPLKIRSSGFIHTGGKIEETLFLILIILNVLIFFVYFILI